MTFEPILQWVIMWNGITLLSENICSIGCPTPPPINSTNRIFPSVPGSGEDSIADVNPPSQHANPVGV